MVRTVFSIRELVVVAVCVAHWSATVSTCAAQSGFEQACRAAEVEEETFSSQGYVSYVRGSSGLILAAPHGGKLDSSFPERTSGVRVSDSNTDRLAAEVRKALENKGVFSHLIVCHLKRKYVDANRPLDAACDETSPAKTVWQDYQSAIDVAKSHIVSEQGRGLFLEIHGHGHEKQRLELGYLLRSRDFALPAANLSELGAKSSVREIVEHGQLPLAELLQGSQSLGAKLESAGLKAVPSPGIPGPGRDAYFNGGWNTRQHGSRDSGSISSIQIEFHRPGIRDSKQAILRSSEQVATAISEFFKLHYPRIENN